MTALLLLDHHQNWMIFVDLSLARRHAHSAWIRPAPCGLRLCEGILTRGSFFRRSKAGPRVPPGHPMSNPSPPLVRPLSKPVFAAFCFIFVIFCWFRCHMPPLTADSDAWDVDCDASVADSDASDVDFDASDADFDASDANWCFWCRIRCSRCRFWCS